MFSTIRKMLARITSFDIVHKRLDEIEAKLDRYERLADENESLWQYLDEQKEMDNLWTGTSEEFESEVSDIMVRQMKTQGDA